MGVFFVSDMLTGLTCQELQALPIAIMGLTCQTMAIMGARMNATEQNECIHGLTVRTAIGAITVLLLAIWMVRCGWYCWGSVAYQLPDLTEPHGTPCNRCTVPARFMHAFKQTMRTEWTRDMRGACTGGCGCAPRRVYALAPPSVQ